MPLAGRDGSRAPESVWFGPDLLLHDLDLGLIHSGASARTLSAVIDPNLATVLLGLNDGLTVAVPKRNSRFSVGQIKAEAHGFASGEKQNGKADERSCGELKGGRHCP
jgi:hypothetical protein